MSIQTCALSHARVIVSVLALSFITITFRPAVSKADVSADVSTEVSAGGLTTQTDVATADSSKSIESVIAGSTDNWNGSLFPSVSKVLGGLLLTLVGIYLTVALLRRMMGRRRVSGRKDSTIELVETCYLAPKQSISLVRVGKRGALLAVTETGITTLLELTPEEIAEARQNFASDTSAPNFMQSLTKARAKLSSISPLASLAKVTSAASVANVTSVTGVPAHAKAESAS